LPGKGGSGHQPSKNRPVKKGRKIKKKTPPESHQDGKRKGEEGRDKDL